MSSETEMWIELMRKAQEKRRAYELAWLAWYRASLDAGRAQ